MNNCTTCGQEIEPPRQICMACSARRNRRFTLAAIIGGAALIAAIAFTQRGGGAKDEETPGGPVRIVDEYHGGGGPAVDKNAPSPAEAPAIAGCDAAAIHKLVAEYNNSDALVAAVRAGTAFQAKCTRSSRLDWDILYALEHLERWKEAEAISDRLLKEDPSDSDFWWWRGKDRRFLGQHDRALADLRQSLADATDRSNGVQIDYIDASAQAIGKRCETAFALRWLTTRGVELRDSAQREFNEIFLGSHCVALDGHGQVTWAASGMKRTKVNGKLGGKKIVAMIDPGLGTTLVRRSVADDRKLARGADLDVLTPTGLGTGAATSGDLSVGGATATDVPMAIVDELPDGVDVVVGLSFLWRFDVQPSPDGERMVAREPASD